MAFGAWSAPLGYFLFASYLQYRDYHFTAGFTVYIYKNICLLVRE